MIKFKKKNGSSDDDGNDEQWVMVTIMITRMRVILFCLCGSSISSCQEKVVSRNTDRGCVCVCVVSVRVFYSAR